MINLLFDNLFDVVFDILHDRVARWAETDEPTANDGGPTSQGDD